MADPQSLSRPMAPPRYIGWLTGLLVILSVTQGWAVIGTLRQWGWVTDLTLPFPLWLKVALDAVWASVFLGLVFALLNRQWQVVRWGVPIITAFVTYQTVWQVVMIRAEYDRGRLPFQLLITTLALLIVWGIAWRLGWQTTYSRRPSHD